jgi:hypothetical protein
MEHPMSFLEKEKYENSDIFELLMSQTQQVPDVESGTSLDKNTDVNTLEVIKEDDEEIVLPPELL